jgi:2-keto-4-pentenoate hydratase/2-oxohepta-3-ene-1,7-dioic acid hydratase in catechol pathway
VKLVTFDGGLGAIRDGQVVSLAKLGLDLLGLIDGGPKALAEARKLLPSAPAMKKAKLLPPFMPRALRDFFAYEDHALAGAARRKEQLAPEWYDQPVYYKGNPRELYGPDDVVPWPSYTRKLDFELEVAMVVGKKGRDISIKDAPSYVFGFMLYNDWSARDIQKNEMVCRMGPAKGKDFANSFGPWLATADEVGTEPEIALSAWVNGEKWSEGSTKLRHWSWAEMLSHVSQGETVLPGDVLGSGTYHKGCGLDLDRWLKPGDRMELRSDKLGTLASEVGQPKAQIHLKYRKEHGAHR